MSDLAERKIEIDNESGALTDWSAIQVGGMGDLNKMVFPAQDLTGAAMTRPRKKQTGYGAAQNFTLQFEKTDASYAAFRTGAEASNPRTVRQTSRTTGTDQVFQVECNIVSSRMITETGENGIDIIEVEFEPTGTEQYT